MERSEPQKISSTVHHHIFPVDITCIDSILTESHKDNRNHGDRKSTSVNPKLSLNPTLPMQSTFEPYQKTLVVEQSHWMRNPQLSKVFVKLLANFNSHGSNTYKPKDAGEKPPRS